VGQGFYASYARHKGYQTPILTKKAIARFDAEIWRPAEFQTGHRVLELGCGTGMFLAYLAAKAVGDFLGVDHDPNLAAHIPESARAHFRCADLAALIEEPEAKRYDRVVMLDVLEHFEAERAVALLEGMKAILAPGAKLVVKVPNAASPWGQQYQWGDLTHRAAYTPLSLGQLAIAADYRLETIYDQKQGSPRRRFTDALLHRVLAWALLTPPDFWGANLYAILAPNPSRR
jgi:SAM-dependent methyltransferase